MSAAEVLTVTCVACRTWSLREAPAMARHGFGVCQQEKHPGVVYSGEWSRICLRFDPLPAAREERAARYQRQGQGVRRIATVGPDR